MTVKKFLQWLLVFVILIASFGGTDSAQAWSGCADYITVQWGDTLSGIAAACGVTAEAIQAANPGLGWWLYAGQVLYIPSSAAPIPAPPPAAGGTYTVQWGDTLGSIAQKYGVLLNTLLAYNPQIWNVNLIYPGQVINLPTSSAPVYNPPVGNPPASGTCTPSNPCNPNYLDLTKYGKTTITYGYGLIVRTGPGRYYQEIDSIYVSAVKDSVWVYRKDSVTRDAEGNVWIEVELHPYAPYKVGWLLTLDPKGLSYTDPAINP